MPLCDKLKNRKSSFTLSKRCDANQNDVEVGKIKKSNLTMSTEDNDRVTKAALAVAAMIKLLLHGVSGSNVHWTRSYFVGFVTTLIGLHFLIMVRPLSEDEYPKALAIAWKDITGIPWADELLIRDEEFTQGADDASKLVKFTHFDPNPREAVNLLKEVFSPRALLN